MAIGDYSKTTYVEGSAPGISATRLNNIENKVDEIDKNPTSAATANKLIIRDASGRAKVVAPSAEDDIALKSNVTTVQGNLDTHKNAATIDHPDASISNSKIANQIMVSVVWCGDYTENIKPIINLVYPWVSPVKLTDPGVLPAGNARCAAWSPSGEYLVVGHDTTPFITIYQKNGTTFTKLADPGTLPPYTGYGVVFNKKGNLLVITNGDIPPYTIVYQKSGNVFTKLADLSPLAQSQSVPDFSPNGQFLAVGLPGTPYINIYEITNDTIFTKLSDPAVLPAGGSWGACSFSPNNEFLAVGHNGSPYITIYQITNNTFTKITDPGILPAGNARYCKFSPDGKFLAVGHLNLPYITVYSISGTTFTKVADPNVLPNNAVYGISWHPSGKYLAVTNTTNSPYITVYSISGTTFTKLTDPVTLPPNTSIGLDFSPNGEFLAVPHNTSPFITLYQTNNDMPIEGVVLAKGIRRDGA